MTWFVKFAYQRDDVWSLYAAAGMKPIIDADEANVRFIWTFNVPYAAPALVDGKAPEGRTVKQGDEGVNALIPWGKVIPITFDAAGNLKVVSRVVVTSEGDASVRRVINVRQRGVDEVEGLIVLPR
jgi:hypothetical protein